MQFADGDVSFSVVDGEPNEHLHPGFAGSSPEVLTDLDGNTVELV